MTNAAHRFLLYLAIGIAMAISVPQTSAQIQVNGANPNNAAQGTVNLDVAVSGSGFKKGAKAQWFVTGTTNPGGVTVNSTAFNNSGQLTANITVAADAVIGNFDIQVVNTDGRTGKGTELFAIQSNGNAKSSCPAVPKLSPPVLSLGCASPSGYTCLDSTFGNATQLPPGGLILTNTDGAVPGTSDLDAASAVQQQLQPDGTLRYVAIGTTTQVVGSTYVNGAALIRYNLNGSLDASFGSGGIAKFFAPANNSLTLDDGVIDSSGNIVVVGNQNSGGTMILLRFTASGVLDSSFNSVGYRTFSNFKASAVRLQSDGKILVGGILFGTKNVIGAMVIRLNPDGSFDSSFANNGQAIFSSLGVLNAIALQTIGSQQYILAAGSSSVGSAEAFAVARLTTAGALDSTFGASGKATTSFCGTRSRIFSISVDSAGNILAYGWNNLANLVYAVARFNANGTLDSTFGDTATPGRTVLDFYGGTNYVTSIQPVLDSLGNQTGFMISGLVSQPTGPYTGNNYWGLAKYRNNGTLDATFGTSGGTVAIDFGSNNTTGLLLSESNLLIQPDGRIVMAGSAKFASGSYAGYNFALARLWP